MTGVHCLQHVERLPAPHLANDDPVRTHPQRSPQQRADVDRARALDARRSRLERDHIALGEAELGGVLDRHDALALPDREGERVERGGLPARGAAGHEDAPTLAHRRDQIIHRLARERAVPDEVVGTKRPRCEPTDGQHGADE